MNKIVVVGASVAGLTAVETLRREGHRGPITVIGEEPHLPYDRPPLSKQFLAGTWDSQRVQLRERPRLDLLDAEWRLGVRAESLDMAAKGVQLTDGEMCSYDGLIIATGVYPRSLPGHHGLGGVHTLRTIDDAARLRSELRAHRRLVVVGAGFLGVEVAAVAREAGLRVALVDPLPTPMFRQVGHEVGERIAQIHAGHGVDVRCGTSVERLVGAADRVTHVALSEGTCLPADLVVIAIGSVPAVGWLAESGLHLTDGVDCNRYCLATPEIAAAGDVASWAHDDLGQIRMEHRTNATEQAMTAARNLLGQRIPFRPIPYFWSDQYGTKLQVFGRTGPDLAFRRLIDHAKTDVWCGVYLTGDRIVGALAWSMPFAARTLRSAVANQARLSDLIEYLSGQVPSSRPERGFQRVRGSSP